MIRNEKKKKQCESGPRRFEPWALNNPKREVEVTGAESIEKYRREYIHEFARAYKKGTSYPAIAEA